MVLRHADITTTAQISDRFSFLTFIHVDVLRFANRISPRRGPFSSPHRRQHNKKRIYAWKASHASCRFDGLLHSVTPFLLGPSSGLFTPAFCGLHSQILIFRTPEANVTSLLKKKKSWQCQISLFKTDSLINHSPQIHSHHVSFLMLTAFQHGAITERQRHQTFLSINPRHSQASPLQSRISPKKKTKTTFSSPRRKYSREAPTGIQPVREIIIPNQNKSQDNSSKNTPEDGL